MDRFSGWPKAFPLSEVSASTIARILIDEIICRFGTPRTLLTDRGSNFKSELLAEVLQILQMKKLNTTAYHEWSNVSTQQF